jgi:uncharacterized membrane protein
MEWLDTALHATATALEAAGVGVIVAGAIIALVSSLGRLRTAGEAEAYYHFRRRLGRAILLGLDCSSLPTSSAPSPSSPRWRIF